MHFIYVFVVNHKQPVLFETALNQWLLIMEAHCVLYEERTGSLSGICIIFSLQMFK
jgi:hypothetical protein